MMAADPRSGMSPGHGHLPIRLEATVRAHATAVCLQTSLSKFVVHDQVCGRASLHCADAFDVGGLAAHHVRTERLRFEGTPVCFSPQNCLLLSSL